MLGVRHSSASEFKSGEYFLGEISHLNFWTKKLDQDDRVITAMYRGCDATGGNWLHWMTLSQAAMAGSVTKATPAECILPGKQPPLERG